MYSTSEDEMSRDSRWNQSAYTDYDVIAGAHLFTSANDAPVNDVTLGFPLTHAGATFAFRDQVGLYNNHVCVCFHILILVFVILHPSYALSTGSKSLNASNTSSSYLPTKLLQPPNLHTFIASSLFNVLVVLVLHLLLLLLGHLHHRLLK